MSEPQQQGHPRDAIKELDSLMETLAILQTAMRQMKAEITRAHARLDALKVQISAEIVE